VKTYYFAVFCGDRYWKTTAAQDIVEHRMLQLRDWCKQHYHILCVVEGKAPGIDTISGFIANLRGIDYIEVPALWTSRGKPAGSARNRLMGSISDRVVAFHPNFNDSKGTKNMIEYARKNEIPYNVFDATNSIIEESSMFEGSWIA
jgi:hypothetical protein